VEGKGALGIVRDAIFLRGNKNAYVLREKRLKVNCLHCKGYRVDYIQGNTPCFTGTHTKCQGLW
jgi:hypothetical protein